MINNEFDKTLKKAIALEKRNTLKEDLQSLEEDSKKQKKSKWFMAASVAIFLSLAGYLLIIDNPPSNKELFIAYYKPYENVVAPVVRNNDSLNKVQKAFTFYDSKKFDKAIIAFNSLKNNTLSEKKAINFYKAIAYIELNDLKKAKNILLKQINNNTDWKNESLWYLALVEIKLGNKKEAINCLNILKERKTEYKKKEVANLLKMLK